MSACERKRRRVDFGPFAASVFAPNLFCGRIRSQFGCGASALALITGVPPENIASENGDIHYSDRFMTRFLRKRNFQTLRLTPTILSNAKSPIGHDHVVLISQLFQPGEGTWGVIFESLYYHNFEALGLSSLSFLNKPILSAYLVVHPKWQIPLKPDKPLPTLSARQRRLSLKSLRKDAEFALLRSWS